MLPQLRPWGEALLGILTGAPVKRWLPNGKGAGGPG